MWTDLIILLAIAVPVALLVLWQRLGLIRSDAARRELTLEADRGRRILEVAPDGLFMWPHDGGGEACSRRLAVLLDLPKGTDSGFADLLARFPGDAAGALETGVDGLRRDGSGFDLLLPSGRRLIHAVGVRAGGEDGDGKVPKDDAAEIGNEGIDDSQVARQGFARGLCLINDRIVAAGSSPSTISLHDLQESKTLLSVNLSMDIRNAIHGLELWPF